jgi:hypothetical protein
MPGSKQKEEYPRMIIECELAEVNRITDRRITGIKNRRRDRAVAFPDDYVDRRLGSEDRRENQGWNFGEREKRVDTGVCDVE